MDFTNRITRDLSISITQILQSNVINQRSDDT
jgi:hypothetical protein